MPGDPEKQWRRDTTWRQGSVLSVDDAIEIGLVAPGAGDGTVIVVVSHDCDLTSDDMSKEPAVELIVGRTVGVADGSFSWGKSPRTLHLPMVRKGEEVVVEVVATSKRQIPKQAMAHVLPSPDFAMTGRCLSVLRGWLAARYNRSAFPDNFVNRLSASKFDIKLAKLLTPRGALISHVFFDLDRGEVLERAEGDPYELSVVLVYPSGDNPESAEEAADELADLVKALAEERFTGATAITLRSVLAISEDDLSISQARALMQWRLEHMTNKAGDQPGPVEV